jgi:hypothetical protein
VRAVDEVARLLKFNREEEGRRRVDAAHGAARAVGAAALDVRDPEGFAGRVGEAVEEVGVVLADEEVRAVDGV